MDYEKILVKKQTLTFKKSKFIAFNFNVNNIEEVDLIIKVLKKQNKDAKHFPYAYKIGNLVKKSDDKEPSNTAGSPILNIIEKRNLNNILIVVIRYLGGIKLGAGGLIRAYSSAAKEVTK